MRPANLHLPPCSATSCRGYSAIYISQSLKFRRPIHIGDEVTTRVRRSTNIDLRHGHVTAKTGCTVGGKPVVTGEAVMLVAKKPAAATEPENRPRLARALRPTCAAHPWRSANFDGLHEGPPGGSSPPTRSTLRASTRFRPAWSASTRTRAAMSNPAEPFRVMGRRAAGARAGGRWASTSSTACPSMRRWREMSDVAPSRAKCWPRAWAYSHVAAGLRRHLRQGPRRQPAQRLQRYGFEDGFSVTIVERMAALDGVKYASTEARRAIAEGRVEEIEAMLGRPFAIEGEVMHGDARGRLLGFPTANIMLDDYVRPAFGVYAVRVRLPDGRVIDGVANIGPPPTVNGTDERLEALPVRLNERPLRPRCSEVELPAAPSAPNRSSTVSTRSKHRARRGRGAAETGGIDWAAAIGTAGRFLFFLSFVVLLPSFFSSGGGAPDSVRLTLGAFRRATKTEFTARFRGGGACRLFCSFVNKLAGGGCRAARD